SKNNNNDIQHVQLKDTVPKKFHRLISSDLLHTYVFSNESEANKFRQESKSNADKTVIVFDKSKPLYSKVGDNLSELGTELVESTEPWVVNLLVDWCHQIEEVICQRSSKYERTETYGGSKASAPGTSSSSACAPGTSSSSACAPGTSSSSACAPGTSSSSACAPGTSSSSAWSKIATSHLIELHTLHSAKFTKPSMKKKDVWKIICSEICNKGFSFTVNQCEQKWKNLTKAYRDCIDHNSKSGNDRKECPFYKELQECYGYKPNVKPLFTLETHKENDTESTDAEQFKAEESTSSDCDAVTPKRKRKNQPSEILAILDDMRNENKEMIKTLKDQHEKRMENEAKKIEIMSQLVEVMKKQ
ncbi:uncharacterized protein LOC134261314, partial [Saccostrea cucullata]|uniref:uncharacterized protein LOC134261314 n=1 Tax=Saccostrea cuccullata TaxID=36930 RepID=UPI002ED2640A